MALIRSIVLVIALLVPRLALADAEPIHIEYRADAGCPTEAEFRRQVFERTASARLAAPGEPGRVFSVELRRANGRVTGSLTIRQPDGETMARRVSADSCSDIAMVLALASALAIDPTAQLAPEQRFELDVPPSDARDASFAVDRPPPAPIGLAVAWTTGTSLGPRFMVGASPQPAIGATLAIDAWASAPSPLALGLGVNLLQTPSKRVRTATAGFRFVSARPQLCPLVLSPRSNMQGLLCFAADLGVVRAWGGNIAEPETHTKFWGAAEGSARLDVMLQAPLYVSAELGAVLPFTRYHFVFEGPETTVHSVSSLAGSATLRIGFRH